MGCLLLTQQRKSRASRRESQPDPKRTSLVVMGVWFIRFVTALEIAYARWIVRLRLRTDWAAGW